MMRWGCLLVLPLLCGCTQHPYSASSPPAMGIQTQHVVFPPSVLPGVGTEASGSITFLNRNMVLPEGHWRVAATQAIMAKGTGLAGAFMALIRVEGTTLRGVLVLAGNARPAPNGFPVSPFCQASDVIWNDVRQAMPQGEQDCALITFERPALWRSAPRTLFAGILQQLDLLNVQPPNYLVILDAHEANRNWSLDEWLYENPDADGIAPDLSTQRALSSWTAFRLASDPARQHFVDDLKARAAPLRLSLRRQIEAHAPYIPNSGLTPA